MIAQKNVSKISNLTAKSGQKIPEPVIERDYCLSWFLFGLAQSPLRENLIFKGGTALRRCHFKNYRFSEDLDFTLSEEISLEDILAEFKNIFKWIEDNSGIKWNLGNVEESSTNTHTFYIIYDGPLPNKATDTKVDITFTEIILQPIEDKTIIKTYDEYTDFLEEPTIRVYSLNEVVIEKVCALFTSARNEPRDLYDIYYLITNEDIDISFLVHDIAEKMKFKGPTLEERKGEFEKKEKRLEKTWKKRLGAQVSELPEFDGVFRAVKRAFRQADLL